MDSPGDSTLESPKLTSEVSERVNDLVYPVKYWSVRVTVNHAEWDVVSELLDKLQYEWYISFPHLGKNGTNPHFHVFLPYTELDAGASDIERKKHHKAQADAVRWGLRKRFDRSGNEFSCIKCCNNGLAKAIQYGSRENTTPITKGANATQWVLNAPKWLNARLKENMSTEKDADGKQKRPDGVRITCENVLRLAFRYRQDHNMRTNDLWEVMLHMLSDGHCLTSTFARTGAPQFYLDVFENMCLKGRYTWIGLDPSCKHKLFRPVRPFM